MICAWVRLYRRSSSDLLTVLISAPRELEKWMGLKRKPRASYIGRGRRARVPIRAAFLIFSLTRHCGWGTILDMHKQPLRSRA
jgi:hypothetical protein